MLTADRTAFTNALRKILPRDGWEDFVDLDLRPLALQVRSLGSKAEPDDPLAILLSHEWTEPVILVGDPGSGKSTVLANVARQLIGDNQLVFFLPMASFDPDKTLEYQLGRGILTHDHVVSILGDGGATLIFDAIDETPVEEIDPIFTLLLRWCRQVIGSGNRVLLSCRQAEVPPWVRPSTVEVSMLPVRDEEIDRVFEEIRQRAGRSSLERAPLEGVYHELREMCRNPLLLMMTAYLYYADGIEGLQDLRSKAGLYRYFFEELSVWERKKRPRTSFEKSISSALSETILADVGIRLHDSGRVYVREAELLHWIGESLQTDRVRALLPASRRLDAQQVKEHLVAAPPMHARPRGGLRELEYGFLHQTFGDVFAAMAIQFADHPVEVIEQRARDNAAVHSDIVVFACGLVDGPERVTQRLVRIAFDEHRSELLLLAGKCMRDRWDMAGSEADDLAMRILEAFKYWDAFDYRLIHALGQLRLSNQLPRRIARDVARFIDKYAAAIPEEMSGVSTDLLCEMLFADDVSNAVNAAYTLGQRRYQSSKERDGAVNSLLSCAAKASGALHEQIIAALKDYAPPEGREFLEGVCQDSTQSAGSRAFALNALGKIGDLRSVDTVVNYMVDHSNKYRDSASWSLQMLGRVAQRTDKPQLNRITAVYAQALRNETEDIEGVFAKGNIMYSLGMLGAAEHVDTIMQVMSNENDAYVVEDGVNALGMLIDRSQVGLLLPYLEHDDPLVRMKAAQSLVTIDNTATKEPVSRLLYDRFPIVRDAVRISLGVAGGSEQMTVMDRVLDALSQPTMDREQVTITVSSDREAALINGVAEALMKQRVIQSRPKTLRREGFVHMVFTQEAFTEVRKRLLEGVS